MARHLRGFQMSRVTAVAAELGALRLSATS